MIKDIPFPHYGLFSVVDGSIEADQMAEGWCYEKAIWKPFFRYFRRGVFIDAGAHWGYWSCLAVMMGATKAIAIEPSPTNHLVLLRNLRRLGDRGVLVPLFAGEALGWAHMECGTGDNCITVPQPKKDEKGTWIIPLDDFGNERITGIKIDVEGFETAVIRGMLGVIELHRPILTSEFHFKLLERYEFNKEELPFLLLQRDYELSWLRSDNFFTNKTSDLRAFIDEGLMIQNTQGVSGQIIAVPSEYHAELNSNY